MQKLYIFIVPSHITPHLHHPSGETCLWNCRLLGQGPLFWVSSTHRVRHQLVEPAGCHCALYTWDNSNNVCSSKWM